MNLSKILGVISAAVIALSVFTSCNGDEPNGGDGESSTGGNGGNSGSGSNYANKAVLNIDGENLTSVNNYTITYDNLGRVESVRSTNGEYFKINYSNNTYETNEEKGGITFDANGYITLLTAFWNDIDEGYQYTGEGSAIFTYDSNGSLVSFSVSSNDTEIDLENNDKTVWINTSKTTISWKNGNLLSASVVSHEEDNKNSVEDWTSDYTVKYGSRPNKYFQMPFSFSETILPSGAFSILASTGLFGKGPAYLPVELIEFFSVDNHEYTYEWDINFTLNNNGSFDIESKAYYEYEYGYSKSGTKSDSAIKGESSGLSLRNFFKNTKKKL